MAVSKGRAPGLFSKAFESLSRRHGAKVLVDPQVSAEACVVGVGKIVGYKNVLSASRMNKAVVVFLNDESLVNKLVEEGVVINDALVPVLPLSAPAKKLLSLMFHLS
ncbi:YTX1 protein, partial [Polypterus senegalus]